MKKVLFMAVLLVSCLSFKFASAQLSVGVNINSQPEWGPQGYDHVDYYYFPDLDIYYDIQTHHYIYYHNNDWRPSKFPPPELGHFDPYHAYKVVINGDYKPWRHAQDYRVKYAQYKGRRDQVIIRDSHDDRYRNHWHGDDGLSLSIKF